MTCFDRRCMLRRQNPIQVPRNTVAKKLRSYSCFFIFSVLRMDPVLNPFTGEYVWGVCCIQCKN